MKSGKYFCPSLATKLITHTYHGTQLARKRSIFLQKRTVRGWGWDQLCWSFRTLAVCMKNISCFLCHLFKNLFCPFHSPNYNIWAIPIFVFPCHQLEPITKGCYKIGITEKKKKKEKGSSNILTSLVLTERRYHSLV